eukprot:comp11404_c0_seq1/m.5789 comp11404_c0_seq1/g.5789  ORF comp11404_c0_seq1/g.5789 comp11404_c0_seq1/m.5789 type:complete len:227 (-) comp11404_c0_seq1:58-738(-)
MDSDLQTYRMQLQQVESALLLDPTNQQLLKLKVDLEQLIVVSSQLQQGGEGGGEDGHTWKVGDVCEAMWLEDGNYYRAIIDTVSVDGRTVTVTFTAYGESQECNVSRLRKPKDTPGAGAKGANGGDSSAGEGKNKDKEKLKAKKEKKRNRLAELEKAKEGEKKKWQDFNKGIIKKTGKERKSIFATSQEGKVGVVGSGKGMTDFDRNRKWAPSTKLNTIAAPPGAR